jgi:Flagellar P-ring protein
MKCRFWLIITPVLAGLCGCAHQNQTRLQAEDEAEAKEADVKTIGEMTTVGNAIPIPVSGVGLVVGLEGTGGDAPPGSYRQFLVDKLLKSRVEHVNELLASPSVSMVLVSATIPPGARKDDSIDVEVSLPPHSKTTSLRGGYLQACTLYNYDTTKNLDPNFQGANRLLIGHGLARAEGPLLVGFGEGDEAARLKQGRIWGGARSNIDRAFQLLFNEGYQRAPIVQKVADRINETFHGADRGILSNVAVAKTKSLLVLNVPAQYKLNLPRYLRVVRLIPYEATPDANSPYRRRLEHQLLDPAHAITAALRLEALGSEGVPTLKNGLDSTHPLVRFAAAEALAYLGNPSCGQELATLVDQQPLLRAFSLTAMASLDEAISHVKLRELLAASDPTARYGAFRALRALDEHDAAVQGEQLNHSYWLHKVAPDSASLVHISTMRHAEIVLFGQEPYLVPPFSILAGEFTITAAPNDQLCTLSLLSVQHGSRRRQCSLKLNDVLHCMADMGGMYPETLELIQQAGQDKSLSCPVAVDAFPRGPSVEDLAKRGTTDPDLQEADPEILQAQNEMGPTPTLYERTAGTAKRAE